MAEDIAKPIRKRMTEQDVAKGIAITLVVLTHSLSLYTKEGREVSNLTTNIALAIGGYIMPFFMVMAGYNYRYKGESYWSIIKKRARQILLPLLYFSVAVWVIMGTYLILRGEITFWPVVKSFFAFWITDPIAAMLGLDASKTYVAQILGPAWFLKSLFSASIVFYAVAPFALKKDRNYFIVTVCLLAASMICSVCSITLPWQFEMAPEMAALMLTGAFLKEKKTLTGKESKKSLKILNFVVCFAFTFTLGMLFPRAGSIPAGRYDSILGPIEIPICLIYAIAGSYIMLSIGRLFNVEKPVGRFFEWLGNYSLFVLLVHGAIMRFLCDIFGITGSEPKVRLTTFVVFFLTLGLSCLFILLMNKILKKRKENRNG